MNLEFALDAPNFANADDRLRWRPMRPCTGVWWADILWLSVVAALDAHILPSMTGGHVPFDIMTPWLVVTFVVGTPTQATTMWLLGSLMMETSVAAPKGIYLCAYWITLSIIFLARKTLSWKHVVPWFVTFFFTSFWVGNFESLVIFLRQDPSQLDFFHFMRDVVRVGLSCLVGMTLAQPWMARFKGEQ